MYGRILVPTDGSPLSRKALDTAIGLAGAMKAEVVALHVVPSYPTSYFEGSSTRDAKEIARIERLWAEHGQALAHEAQAAAEAAGVRAKSVVVTTDGVSDAILAAVRKHRCDLVVMASHGRKGIKRLLLGSETQHVLTRGNVPVLVVR